MRSGGRVLVLAAALLVSFWTAASAVSAAATPGPKSHGQHAHPAQSNSHSHAAHPKSHPVHPKPHPAHPKHPAHPAHPAHSNRHAVRPHVFAGTAGQTRFAAAHGIGHSAIHLPHQGLGHLKIHKAHQPHKHGIPLGSAHAPHHGRGVPAGGKGHAKHARGKATHPTAPGSTSTSPKHTSPSPRITPVEQFGQPSAPHPQSGPSPQVPVIHHPHHQPVEKPGSTPPPPPSAATGKMLLRSLNFSLGLVIPVAICLVVAACGVGLLLLTRRRSD